MSRLNSLKFLLLSFLSIIILNSVFVTKSFAFTGGGKWSNFNTYVNNPSSIPSYEQYEYFYNCFNVSGSVYALDLEKLQSSDVDLTYEIDFPAGTNFEKFQFINNGASVGYSLNCVSDSAVHINGGIQSISYSNYENFDNYSDGRVVLSILVYKGSSGLLSFKFFDSSGSAYIDCSPCPLSEQTTAQAFKEVNGYDYGGTKPEEPPVIKPPDGGLDSIPIDNTSTDTVIESIIEGLKTFFKWLLKFLVPIILGAVSLGVIVKGAIWLWRKAKNWVSSS